MMENWIRRFKAGWKIAVYRELKKIFQKRLAAGMAWATLKLPLRTGAPFFLLKDGSAGRRR